MEWWKPSKPGEVRDTPWLHPDAIAYLAGILSPDFTVIEHGSGGSTLWLAERVKLVWAFESDPDWQAVISKRARTNTKVFSADAAPTIFVRGMTFDLVLIDGEPLESRCAWIEAAPKLAPHGWVVLDNANRPQYAAQRATLSQLAELEYRSPLVGNHLVTEFWRVK